MKKTFKRSGVALLAGSAAFAAAPLARAATIDCTNPSLVPHPVYIAGANAVKSYLEALAGLLGDTISLIYAAPASCIGVGDILTPGQTEGATATFSLVRSTGFTSCSGGPIDGGYAPYPSSIYVDIGVSDVYASSCVSPTFENPTPSSGFADFTGAIQPFVITVPWASSQYSISAEAAYVVFGFGAGSYQGTAYTVGPWTETADIFTRGDTSGTQLIIADAIGLHGDKWLSAVGADAGSAQVLTSAGDMVTAILGAGATAPNATIGILGSASVDPLKTAAGGLRPLAFQGIGQDCGYFPDSVKDLFDKINVRQGRYEIWGPEHFLTRVDSSGKPLPNANAASNPQPSVAADVTKVIDIITHDSSVVTATSSPSLQQVVAAETAAYYVPTCAMQVSRTTEDGPEASYQPPAGCGCFFESQPHGGAGNISSYCQTCTTSTDCTAAGYPACNFGYCEAQ